MIFLLGYPGSLGGANTECWHTLQLWRKYGCEITAIPTWSATDEWRARLDGLGIPTIETVPEKVADVPGLAGSVVVSFCNQMTMAVSARLKKAGCKLIWVNCMTFPWHWEGCMMKFGGAPAAWIFQTKFQRNEIEPYLFQFGYHAEQGHVIRGAFTTDDWPYNPKQRHNGDLFTIGKIARPDDDKWHPKMWKFMDLIPGPKKVLLMGANKKIQRLLGESPPWGHYLHPNVMPAQDFYRQLDCLVCVNGFARENWPRVGLEAMATGVPVIAPDAWGWREMIGNGYNGYLYENIADIPGIVARLRNYEGDRLALTRRARTYLEEQLAEPETIWRGWERVFESLQ